MSALSLYIHIPFCASKCNYCDFYSVLDTAILHQYFEALMLELENYQDIIDNNIVETVYVGGGTPSLVPTDILWRITSKFRKLKTKELTIEVNPESFSEEKCVNYRELGFNRLSLGIQSFVDSELKTLGRVHTASQAKSAVSMASRYFDNVSLDLMWGIPCQNRASQLFSLQQAIAFEPAHISCYELTPYEGTPLFASGFRGQDSIKPFLRARSFLQANGYQQYEISNYAKPGKESVHNLGYWQDRQFIGLGPTAASYFNNERILNNSTMSNYLALDFSYEKEVAQESEYIISALRTLPGLSLSKFAAKYQQRFEQKYQKVLKDFRALFFQEGDYVRLTLKGLILSNRVFEEFV